MGGHVLAIPIESRASRVDLGDVRLGQAAGHTVTLHGGYAEADVVVNAVPGDVSVEMLSALPLRHGTVLIDVANAVHIGPDGFAVGLCYPGTSFAEALSAALPGVHVVKTLNTMHVSLMAHPTPSVTAFLSGDSAAAKSVARGLLGDLGWPSAQILDLGAPPTARWVEEFALAIRPVIQVFGPVPFGLGIAR